MLEHQPRTHAHTHLSAAHKMQGHLASMRPKPVLPKIYALPCTQHEEPATERNRKLHRRQRRADVGGHVIRALVAVPEERIAIRNEAGQETFEISPHVRIGILLHDQAC